MEISEGEFLEMVGRKEDRYWREVDEYEAKLERIQAATDFFAEPTLPVFEKCLLCSGDIDLESENIYVSWKVNYYSNPFRHKLCHDILQHMHWKIPQSADEMQYEGAYIPSATAIEWSRKTMPRSSIQTTLVKDVWFKIFSFIPHTFVLSCVSLVSKELLFRSREYVFKNFMRASRALGRWIPEPAQLVHMGGHIDVTEGRASIPHNVATVDLTIDTSCGVCELTLPSTLLAGSVTILDHRITVCSHDSRPFHPHVQVKYAKDNQQKRRRF